ATERVRRTHHRTDVEVVRPVLDRDMERVTDGVQVGDDRLPAPVPVPIDDVAAVTARQEFGIVVVTLGPRALPRSHAHLACLVLGVGHRGGLEHGSLFPLFQRRSHRWMSWGRITFVSPPTSSCVVSYTSVGV